MKYHEIEYKYKAGDIALTTFDKFCKDKNPKASFYSCGYDHFYDNPKRPDTFYRFRSGPDINQLTFKIKTADKNNFVRGENNLDLASNMTKEAAEAYVSQHDYKYNTSIFKVCFVYKYDYYTLVYYNCFDKNMKEWGRYIEIEMDENHEWANEQEALNELAVLEKLCKPLGISPANRLRLSLYELARQ